MGTTRPVRLPSNSAAILPTTSQRPASAASNNARANAEAANEAAEDTPKPAAVAEPARTLSVDDLLAARLTPTPGVGPVSLQDMDRAITEGANGSRSAGAASLLGLMADEPDLVDHVCSRSYEARRMAHLRAVDE
jgi:hypothetical protein